MSHSTFSLGRALGELDLHDHAAAVAILAEVLPADLPGVRRGMEDAQARPHGRPLDEQQAYCELLDQLPRWNALSEIPVFESPGMSWKDEPFMAEVQGLYSGRRNVILVGDKAFYEMRREAINEARAIVRDGLRDVLEWLEAAGVRVW